MGKPAGKKKSAEPRPSDGSSKHDKSSAEHKAKVFDADTAVFIDMAKEMKDEGNKLFQRRDYEGALIKYEKAVKLLPKSYAEAANLRSNMAACYMQMVPVQHHRAINECSLALEVSPKHAKALLKRARCFEALNKLSLAYRDVDTVLGMEPNNLTAIEISERLKKEQKREGVKLDDVQAVPLIEHVVVKQKPRKKKSNRTQVVNAAVVVKHDVVIKEEPPKAVKLVLGEDIRWAQIPTSCSLLNLRSIVRGKFPNLNALLIKYKDKEGDLMTITTLEELKWAEECADPQGSIRLYIVEVDPDQDPLYEEEKSAIAAEGAETNQGAPSDNGRSRPDGESGASYIDEWIVQFARLFKNHVGINSDSCLDLHELGMTLYTEAMEDTVTSEEARAIFKIASGKFQEMAALALLNCGNVHMSQVRKRLFLPEDSTKELILEEVKAAHEWAQGEYVQARLRYEEALGIMPDFYEAYLALGLQQFEQAKLSWYHAVADKVDFDNWPSSEVLELFNNAEDSLERCVEMWLESEEQRVEDLDKRSKEEALLQEMGMEGLFKEMPTDEAAVQASNMRSQINFMWGTMLYERSVVEFKLSLPSWEECLMEAIEKFKLAGVPQTDIAVMIKNHCANKTTQEGLAFEIDEIVQACNEMYDAKRWISGVPSFRLEPLFRRKAPKLHHHHTVVHV